MRFPTIRLRRPRPRTWLTPLALVGTSLGIYTGYRLYENGSFQSLRRNAQTATTLAWISLDYWLNLPPLPDRLKPTIVFDPSIMNPDTSEEEEAYLEAKCAIHARSAQRCLDLFRANGGVYLKLGQHLAALVYLLPIQYTDTLKVLQDQCPSTPFGKVTELIESDLGLGIKDMFDDFEKEPVGVASLAQVHKATLKSSSGPPISVAVKIQHPGLDATAEMDIKTCTRLVKWVKYFFPKFEFDWLADELALSLPQELDFVNEAANAIKIREMFHGDSIVYIPKIYIAKKRVLVMECNFISE